MAPEQVKFYKIDREFGDETQLEQPPRAGLAVQGTKGAVAVVLLGDVIEGEIGVVVDRRLELLRRSPVQNDAIEHRVIAETADIAMIEAHDIIVVRKQPRLHLARIDGQDPGPIGADLGQIGSRKERPDFIGQVRRHDLVGIDIQNPLVTAVLLGEPLLRAISVPIAVNDDGAVRARDLDRPIDASGVHDEDFVNQWFQRRDRCR